MRRVILILVIFAGLIFAGCNNDVIDDDNDTSNITNITIGDFDGDSLGDSNSFVIEVEFGYFVYHDDSKKFTGPWSKEYM